MNLKVSEKKRLDKLAIVILVLGILLMVQGVYPVLLGIGFFLTLIATIVHAFTSHFSLQATNSTNRNSSEHNYELLSGGKLEEYVEDHEQLSDDQLNDILEVQIDPAPRRLEAESAPEETDTKNNEEEEESE